MDDIVKSLEDNINRLLRDGYRTYSWDNEVRCSEAVKNLCIAHACLTRKDIKWVLTEENNSKID